MKVAFIGHRTVDNKKGVKRKVAEVVERLIIKENADFFFFGSNSEFDDICYDVVTKLKKQYPDVCRVDFLESAKFVRKSYDETYFPSQVHGAGVASYIRRNEAMIDFCDVLVVYYNEDYSPKTNTKSGTKIAINYARKENKRIINVFL